MNKVYKSIWNAVTRSWTAVSEIKKSRGKKNNCVKLSIFLLSLLSLSINCTVVNASSWSNGEDKQIGSLILGNNSNPYDDSFWGIGTDIWGSSDHSIVFETKNSTLTDLGGTNGFISLSNSAFEQEVITTNSIFVADHSSLNAHVYGAPLTGNDQVKQTLIDENGTPVAVLNFYVSTAAYDLVSKNLNSFGAHLEGDLIYLDSDLRKGYNTGGIAYGDVPDDGSRIWMLTLLTGVDIQSGQTLVLDNISGEQTFSAGVIGSGNIEYSGNGTLNLQSVIEHDADGSDYQGDANTYTGSTTVNGITLNLTKSKSLGNTSLLAIENNAQVIAHTNTEQVDKLQLNEGILSIQGNEDKKFEVGSDGAVIEANGQIKGQNVTFTVTDGNLVVHSQNVDFSHSTVNAKNITVNYTDAFGDETSSVVQEQYVFDNVQGDQYNEINAGQIVLDNASNVRYDQSATIDSTAGTLIQGASQLQVTGLDQLGGAVEFGVGGSDLIEYNKLTINYTDSDKNMAGAETGTWTFGDVQFASNDANAVVVANGVGSGDAGSRFTISDTAKWSEYSGWVRISNTNFNLNTKLSDSVFLRDENSVGLSVGSGGHVYITDRAVQIDRFGWSNDNNNNGVLDLTQVQAGEGNSDSPILEVQELRMEGSGTIRLDPTDYLAAGSALTGGSVLDYQNGSDRFWIIKAGDVTGSAIGSVTLDKTTGDQTSTTEELHNSQNNLAAYGIWDYRTDLVTQGEGQKGVYLTYSLTELQLAGGNNIDNALEIRLDQSNEDELSIKIGNSDSDLGGIIKVTTAGQGNKSIALTNAENSFTGLVQAGEGVQLTAKGGALGQGGVALHLQKGATFAFFDDAQQETQHLNGLQLDEGSKVILGENKTLELALNSDYLGQAPDPSTTSEIGTNQLEGAGNLTLTEGTISFTDASNLFTNFSGDLTVSESAVMGFSDVDGEIFRLVELNGNGTASLSGEVQIGNLSNYYGDIKLTNGTKVIFDASTELRKGTSDASLSVSTAFDDTVNTSVVFNQFESGSEYINDYVSFGKNITDFTFEETDGIFLSDSKLDLTLENSNVIRTYVDSLDTSAHIGKNSSLTYQFTERNSGEISLDKITGKGTLELGFASETQLSVSGKNDNFTGQLRFENAIFEVGTNHTIQDINNQLANENALYIDSGSTLVMNGRQTFGQDLTLGDGATLNFTSNRESFNLNGLSANAMIMQGNAVTFANGQNIKVNVEVDTSLALKEADTSGTLMQAVRDQNNSGLSLVLIDGIDPTQNAGDLANHMQLVTEGNTKNVTATYQDANDQAIADLTTSIGLSGINNQIGLNFGEVTTVAIYGGQTAVFEATGDVNGDVISAKITNRDEEAGSAHFTGKGTIELTNSSNDYSGATTIDGEATVITTASNALGHSSNVIVGSDTQGTLVVNADQEHLGGLQVNDTGSLSVAEDKVFTINNSHDSYITGELSGKGKISLVNSELTYTNDVEKTLSVAFETQDYDSTFIKKGLGKLDFEQQLTNLNLSLQEGSLVLDNGDSLTGLEVAQGTSIDVNGLVNLEVLVGTGATFNMALDFGSGSQDELVDGKPGLNIGNGTGSHFLNVTSKDLNKGAEEIIKIVHMGSGDATFTLLGGKEAISSGGYDYLLKSQAIPDGGTEYFLDSASGPEHIRNTTVTAGSYIGIAYAAQLFDLSLHDRVGNRDWINPVTGEKQTTSLWMHHTMSHERYRDSTAQLRMRTTSNTTMLGGDLVQFTTGDSGLAYAGLMGGYGTMDTKSRSKVTNLHSKAETDAWGVGAYAGWKANSDGQTGPYVDGWVMFTHANSDVTGVDQNTEDVKGQGLSASLEAGWGFKVGSVATKNGKVANFTVEPHASVTWFGMQYDEIHNDAQDVKFEGENNVRTRLGARAILTQEGNNNFNAFVEANWVHNTQEYGAMISGLTVDQAGSRNQGEGRIGVDWRVTDSLSVWGRVGASFGSDNYNEREGSIGVRYQF